MKKSALFFFAVMMISLNAISQVTYLADTAFTTDIGYEGAGASSIYQPFGYYDGFAMTNIDGYSIGDSIIVPAGAEWVFDTVIIYGYQYGTNTESPFTGAYLQIYTDTALGSGGISIWGDTCTNLLASTGFTGIYRVDPNPADGGLLSTSRPIMYLKLFLPRAPHLNAGTYWLQWSVAAAGTGLGECPPKVLPGRINPPGQNGVNDYDGHWTKLYDGTQTVGFNKVIVGSAAVTSISNTAAHYTTLGQNFPNPCNEVTTIPFYTKESGYAALIVCNALGQIISTLTDGETSAGEHKVTFNIANLPDGLYYYQLNTSAGMESKRIWVLH